MAAPLTPTATALSALTPAPWNPRTIRTSAFKALCASLEADPEFLWRRPVLAMADGTIYAGNQRYRAAVQLGWREVPAVVEDVPDRLARERALRDNNTAGEYEEQELAELLYGLQEDGGALEALAFDKGEVDRLLASVGVGGDDVPAAEIDRAEELQAQWKTALGQLWEIGRHRLLCGDSTKADDVARVLDGQKADLVLADPPYGMNLTGYAGGDNTFHGKTLYQRTPERVTGDAVAFDPSPLIALYGCKEQFWWGGDWYYTALPPGGSWIIWDKRGSEEADAVLGAPFEVCWSRQRHARKFIRKPWGGIFSKERGDPERWHATQKPIVLMQTVLDWHAPADGLVLDPFVGSGAIPLAAEATRRRCFGIEVEPKYVAVTLERLSHMGLEPRLQSGPS